MPSIRLVAGFEQLSRITSDCKPWPGGGRLGVCAACAVIQKAFDPAWTAECSRIYREYAIYHQSLDGAEQTIFDGSSGQAATRSDRLIGQLVSTGLLPSSGRLVDIGCGNGVLLAAMSRRLHNWTLTGFDIDDGQRARVESIPRVDKLVTGSIDALSERFDVATLSHTLEHIPDPVGFLARLRHKLAAEGLLVVLVPNAEENPFDLLVADHASHFTGATLRRTIAEAGYEVVAFSTRWVPKELAVVAIADGTPRHDDVPRVDPSHHAVLARAHICWLLSTSEAARGVASEVGSSRFGVFGTSIAATWLGTEMGDGAGFFVDEDPNRTGMRFLGRPVHHPRTVPAGAHVYLGLAPMLVPALCQRLRQQRPDVTFHAPRLS